MKYAFIIHGTEGHPQENWFPWLKSKLESRGYTVITPQFPTPPIVAAKIDEWFDVLKQHEDKVTPETIMIGHSLGGIFLLRVLEQQSLAIKASFFTGTPIGIKPIKYYDRDFAFSGFQFNWEHIKHAAGHIEVFHSDDDPFVDLENGKQLAQNLDVTLNFIPNAGHFRAAEGFEEFPQLLTCIDAAI